jgi:hypothetical protein
MKATLEFNLPEEQDEFTTTTKATSMSCALSEIRNRVFRPARKHGYSDQRIQKLLESHNECGELVELLEDLFTEVLNEYDVLDQA